MTQEDKDLLLQDLCARLPYYVKVDIAYSKEHGSSDRLRICSEGCLILNTDVLGLCIEDEIYIKPYLRPMPSMTEDENKEAKENGCIIYWDTSPEDKGLLVFASPKGFDWLNKKMFDYRGLIGKDLVLEAPKGMYNLDNK